MLIFLPSEQAADGKEEDLAQFLSCLSSLSVRNEYCQAVAVDEEGLKCLFTLLVKPDQVLLRFMFPGKCVNIGSFVFQGRTVVRESLRLIKTLAGNDNVKKEIQTSGGIAIVINSITKNLVS